MKEFLLEHKSYIFIFIGLVIVALFGVYKAVTSSARHRREYKEEEARILFLKSLKEKFARIDYSLIQSASASELLEGIALHYQLKLQNEPDMIAAFNLIPLWARYAYTLDIFASEGASPVKFFKENGKPLTLLLSEAFTAVGQTEQGRLLKELEIMFDDEREDVSLSYARADEIEKEFLSSYSADLLHEDFASYVKAMPESEFVNKI